MPQDLKLPMAQGPDHTAELVPTQFSNSCPLLLGREIRSLGFLCLFRRALPTHGAARRRISQNTFIITLGTATSKSLPGRGFSVPSVVKVLNYFRSKKIRIHHRER